MGVKRKVGLLASAALVCSGGQAFAQADAAASVEELIVTARKREERLVEVPVSVSALSAQQLEENVLGKIDDFLALTPSASIVLSGPQYLKDVSLRGQGGGRNGFSESATGLYRNGIYAAGGGFGGRSFNPLDLFDVRAFEVYRGPQGALYGRNAVGGAVNVTTQAPEFGFGGHIRGAYDDRARTTYEGVLNAELAPDQLALRLGVVGYNQTGGFVYDIPTGRDLDRQSFAGQRLALRYAPNAGVDLVLTYERSIDKSPGFSVLGQRTDVANRAEVFDPNPYGRRATRYGYVKIKEETGFLQGDFDLSFADLAVVAAVKSRKAGRGNEDLDHFLGFEGVGGSDLVAAQFEDFDRKGIEARLTSRADSPIQWLFGVDYQRSSDDVVTQQLGTTTVAALREQGTRIDSSEEDLETYSAFGSLEWRPREALAVALGGRLSRDVKTFVFTRTDLQPTPTNTGIPTRRSKQVTERFSPEATVKYEIGDRGQVYARAASAYRPGGFNIGVNDVSALAYEPETSWGAELGFKGQVAFGVSGSAAIFYQEVENAQAVTQASLTETTAVLQNVEGLRTWGLELTLDRRWSLGPGDLTVSLSAGTQTGEFDDGSRVRLNGVLYDISGLRTNRNRDLSGSLIVNYQHPLGSGWRAFVNAALTTELGGYRNVVGQLKIPGVSQPNTGFSLVNLKAGVRSADWLASVYISNLADKVYEAQEVSGNVFYNDGRVIGFELRRSFGR